MLEIDEDEVTSPLEKVGTMVALTKFCIYSPASANEVAVHP